MDSLHESELRIIQQEPVDIKKIVRLKMMVERDLEDTAKSLAME